jgi:hypothetical protein
MIPATKPPANAIPITGKFDLDDIYQIPLLIIHLLNNNKNGLESMGFRLKIFMIHAS